MKFVVLLSHKISVHSAKIMLVRIEVPMSVNHFSSSSFPKSESYIFGYNECGADAVVLGTVSLLHTPLLNHYTSTVETGAGYHRI